MKRKGVPGENLRFDAAGRSDQYDIVSLIGSDAREGERGHQMAPGAAAGDQNLQMRNAKCGMRNLSAGFE